MSRATSGLRAAALIHTHTPPYKEVDREPGVGGGSFGRSWQVCLQSPHVSLSLSPALSAPGKTFMAADSDSFQHWSLTRALLL